MIENEETWKSICPCGCGNEYTSISGTLKYGNDSELDFLAALMMHGERNKHIWFSFMTGSWFEDDARDCVITIHTWRDGDNVNTNVEDAEESPWKKSELLKKMRFLSRDEVASQEGGKEWAYDCYDLLAANHKDIYGFLLEDKDFA